jgi:hypothetical protein
LANVTFPGPLNLLHVLVTVAPVGNPSSVTEPLSDAPVGNVIVAAVPALTVGATFVGAGGFTVIVTSLNADSCVSVAVNRRT